MDNIGNLYHILVRLEMFLTSDRLTALQDAEAFIFQQLNYIHRSIQNNLRSSQVMLTIQAVLDYLWEKLNTGHWSQVPEKPRALFALCSLFKVIRIIQEAVLDNDKSHQTLNRAIRAADMGLLLGFGCFEELSLAAKLLSRFLTDDVVPEASIATSLILKQSLDDWIFPGIMGIRVPSEICPSLEYFYLNYFLPRKPVKLKDCIGHWPALSKWNDLHYLVNIAGPRLIPIEIGASYTKDDWGMKLMHFEDYVLKFIINKNDKMGYLAQHQLFDQIPELKNDFFVPEYCALSESGDDPNDPDINVWFGPAGTVSPLHYDTKHNLLSQVIGRKRIILYSPDDSENLYSYESKMLFNTSNVDPYSPDYEKFPKFKNAKAYECHLHPGQMLYIPPKWWHHVKSLDTSFSISFWWE